MPKIDPPQDHSMLVEAFKTFSEASEHLQKAYSELQNHTTQLDFELKQTNERLSKTLDEQERISLHFKSILQSLNTGILVVDLYGKVVEMNPYACRLLRIEPHHGSFLEVGLPKEVEDYIATCLEHSLLRVPKKSVKIEIAGEQLDLDLSFSLVRPAGGGIMSVLVLLQDTTLMTRLKQQSNRNARLAAMGEMAAELAHEIRNPLGSIKLFASLLAEDLAENPNQVRLADQINQGVSSIDRIVSNMLTFSADVKPQCVTVDLVSLLDATFDLFELERRSKNVDLGFHNHAKRYKVSGDPQLLKQMFLNLCLNAVKAVDQGGQLTVDVRTKDDYVEVVVQDNGIGIEPARLHKIFDPFFSTFSGGTGLGLSVVHKVIEKHRGAIDVKSTVGEGTSVFVTLPLEGESEEVT